MLMILTAVILAFRLRQETPNVDCIPPFEIVDDSSITVTEVKNDFQWSTVSNCFGVEEVEKALYICLLSLKILRFELTKCKTAQGHEGCCWWYINGQNTKVHAIWRSNWNFRLQILRFI